MAAAKRVLIPGGSGVFGRLLARELLATTDVDIVIAGRDPARAEAARLWLDGAGRVETLSLDLEHPDALRRVARGTFAVACTAGPARRLSLDLPMAVAEAGSHWLDMAEDPQWVLPRLGDERLDRTARDAGVAVIPGCSTVPALSGALARWCMGRVSDARRARITLFIGNRNAKGTGSVAGALIGRLRDPCWVQLPWGRTRAFRFDSPDQKLLRNDLGIETEFRVALEWPLAARLVSMAGAALDPLRPEVAERVAGAMAFFSSPLGLLGSATSCLQVEMWPAKGDGVAAALVAEGQRLPILPPAMALERLAEGGSLGTGVLHPAELFDPDTWMAGLRQRGVRLLTRPLRE